MLDGHDAGSIEAEDDQALVICPTLINRPVEGVAYDRFKLCRFPEKIIATRCRKMLDFERLDRIRQQRLIPDFSFLRWL